jgi:glyoxalase family protein
MELTGLHHVTAVTATARENVDFYTRVLGMRLVKKTVNQDDVTAYHLFYGDQNGSPGTEVTFFDWPRSGSNQPGAGAISEIALSTADDGAVAWWASRLKSFGVNHTVVGSENGASVLDFSDNEGQKLQIVGKPASGQPWAKGSVPVNLGLRGMHHVTLTVRHVDSIANVLVGVLGMRQTTTFARGEQTVFVFETGVGGAGASVYVAETDEKHLVRIGAGGVHHVAFRTPNIAEQTEWLEHIRSHGLHASGLIDRYYFNSIYFREPGGILFEIATDGPGFDSDEDSEHLGERLALPPFLEPRRSAIESGLLPL